MSNAFHQSCALLSEQRIAEAIVVQRRWLNRLQDSALTEQADTLMGDYQRIADYFISGQRDDNRTEQISALIRRAYDFVDIMYERMRVLTNKRQEFAILRDRRVDNFPQIKNAEDWTIEDIFNYFWLKQDINEEDISIFLHFVSQNLQDEPVVALYGLWLNLMRRFSQGIIIQLFDLASGETLIATNAMMLLILALLYYNSRLQFYPDIIRRLEALTAAKGDMMIDAIYQILYTQRTPEADKAVQEMHGQIMSELTKLDSKDRPPIIFVDENEDVPEWLEDISDKYSKTVDSISQLSKEGVDVNFSNLKDGRQDPFFKRSMLSWFIPFSRRNTIFFDTHKLQESDINTDVISFLENSSFPESDKYALYILFYQFAKVQKINEEQFKLLSDEFSQFSSDEEMSSTTRMHNTLLDLYRFFRLNTWEYPDPLPQIVSAIPTSLLFFSVSPTTDELLKIADTYSKINSLTIAIHIYEDILKDLPSDIVYQKLGYCQERQGNYEKALAAYERADIITPDVRWTMWHKVKAYNALQQYDKAATTLERLMQCHGEKQSYLSALAQLYTILARNKEAIQLYYKMILLFEENITICRALSRLLLKEGQLDNAINYAQKVLLYEDKTDSDIMLMGHLHSLKQQWQTALDVYSTLSADANTAMQLFDEERQQILSIETFANALTEQQWILLRENLYMKKI